MSPCMFLQCPCRNNCTHQPEQLSIVCIDCMRGEQHTHTTVARGRGLMSCDIDYTHSLVLKDEDVVFSSGWR